MSMNCQNPCRRDRLTAVALLALAGCGGGGSAGPDAPAQAVTVSQTVTDLRFGEPVRTPSGEPIVFRYTLYNPGPAAARNLQLDWGLGPNLQPAQLVCQADPPPAPACPADLAQTRRVAELPAQARLLLRLETAERQPDRFLATAWLGASTDPAVPPAQRALTLSLTVWQADLAVRYAGPASARPGERVRYTVTVDNLGPDEHAPWLFWPDRPVFDDGVEPELLGCVEEDGGQCLPGPWGLVIPAGGRTVMAYAATAPDRPGQDWDSTFTLHPGGSDRHPANDRATLRVPVRAP